MNRKSEPSIEKGSFSLPLPLSAQFPEVLIYIYVYIYKYAVDFDAAVMGIYRCWEWSGVMRSAQRSIGDICGLREDVPRFLEDALVCVSVWGRKGEAL